TYVVAFIFATIWGRVGDKYGRRKLLFFFATMLGLSIFLMGFSTSVWQLFILRLVMGIFTGFIPMSQALIATQTPEYVAGIVLGTLQTGSITGNLMGPLCGGVLAVLVGYGATFQLTSISVILSAILVLFGIKEMKLKTSTEESNKIYSSKEVILHILKHPVLLIVLLLSTLIQLAHFSVQPILSLYVAKVIGTANIAFFSGTAFFSVLAISAAVLGNLLMSRRLGKLGDRVGYIKMLIALLFMAGLVYLPAAFVTSIWQLVSIRFLLGIAIGGIVPLRVAYIRHEAPLSMQGEVLGYNTSLRFLGNIIGPALGGMLSGMYGFSSVFFVTSGLLIISGVIMLVTWYKYEFLGKETHSMTRS